MFDVKNVPYNDLENALDLMWVLLREVEEKTTPEKDILNARDVEAAYRLLKRIGYTTANPRWVSDPMI